MGLLHRKNGQMSLRKFKKKTLLWDDSLEGIDPRHREFVYKSLNRLALEEIYGKGTNRLYDENKFFKNRFLIKEFSLIYSCVVLPHEAKDTLYVAKTLAKNTKKIIDLTGIQGYVEIYNALITGLGINRERGRKIIGNYMRKSNEEKRTVKAHNLLIDSIKDLQDAQIISQELNLENQEVKQAYAEKVGGFY